MASIYERIIALFNEHHVKYTEAEHHQEGHGTHVAQFHGLDETCGATFKINQNLGKSMAFNLFGLY